MTVPLRTLPVVSLLVVLGTAATAGHPRLFVTEERIAELRDLCQRPDTHHGEAYAAMQDRVEGRDEYDGHVGPYKLSYRAREAAFLSLVAPEAADRERYADIAYGQIESMYPGERVAHDGYGLSRAMMGLGIGLPYDWCHEAWTDEQRAFVDAKIELALDRWPRYSHANLGDVRGSNWVGVCRGGELVLLLAAGEEEARAERYRFLLRELRRHIENGFGSLGVSQEGLGYSEYPGGFLLPAVYAARQLGDRTLWEAARRRAWWKLAMYAESFQGPGRKYIQWGVGSGGYNEGWTSLLLNQVPDDELPYYLWFYDRHMGIESRMPADRRYDGDRAGAIWALLYYPADVEAKDPTGVYPAGVADDRGYAFFRDRWKDAGDVLTSCMADAHHHGHAWDQPDVGALGLMAYDTRFFGGPGKKREDVLYTTLLVDGEYQFKGSSRHTGRSVSFRSDTTGGYVVVDGGALYDELGVDRYRRHHLVDFDRERGSALLSTLDVIESADSHTYTWQANLGSENDDGGVEVRSGTESGRATFTLIGRAGRVKGWVMHPAGARIARTDDPLRIDTSGEDRRIWIVMVAAPGEVAGARFRGEGPGSAVSIAGRTVRLQRDTITVAR